MQVKSKEFSPGYCAPREKLLKYGVNTLSDTELLAIFLRTGLPGMNVMVLAHQLLQQFGSLHQLVCAKYKDFCAKPGLGLTKYSQLQASVELSRRYLGEQLNQEKSLTNSTATRYYLQNLIGHQEREVFVVLLLDNQHRFLLHKILFTGTYNAVEVHPREVVRAALNANASAVILAHNHPSGAVTPSQADHIITEKIISACQLVDIRVLDHMIICRNNYISFAENGWL